MMTYKPSTDDTEAPAMTTVVEERATPHGRRRIIAAAAALVVGAIATGAPPRARANDGSVLVVGSAPNTSSSETTLIMTTGNNANAAFSVHAAGGGNNAGVIAVGDGTEAGIKAFGGGVGGAGVIGSGGGGNADGVRGSGSGNFTGVVGFGGPKGGSGVLGIAGGTGAQIGAGVIGITPSFNLNTFDILAGVTGGSNLDGVPGVYGKGTTGNTVGVYGSGSLAAAGVFGINSFAQGIGVQGFNEVGPAVQGNTGSGYGVLGQAASNGIGVYGVSNTGFGVVGTTNAASFGVYGVVTANGAAAFAGGTNNAAAYAAIFTGTTIVNGQFVVNGGPKNAAVKHPDGTHRLLYCMEAPEAWFEDFGEGKLVGGKATVTLDPDFAAVADTGSYHVFLTPLGESKGLYIAGKSAATFDVREPGTSNLAFSWRVVAKRKDVKGARLAKFTVPEPKVELPKLPEGQKLPPLVKMA